MKQYQTVTETKEVGREKYLIDEGGQKIKTLSSAAISNEGILTLNGFTFAQMTEYEAPKMNVITKQYRPPDPVGALMNTAVTVGLNVLLAPKRTGSQLVGDTTDERVTSTYLEKSKAVATGNEVWEKDEPIFSAQIAIDGILDRTLNLDYVGVGVDLSKYFHESPYDNLIQVKITCTSCGDVAQIQTPDYKLFATNKVIDFDLGSFKRRLRVQKLQTERDEQKRIADQRNATLVIQQKCLRMGLSVGSEDFNLCISSQKLN